jgi:predicted NBD/HSP70 family sugar kinase
VLVQRYHEISGINDTGEFADFDKIIDLVKENDPHAVNAIHEVVEYLAIGIANIVNLLNPSLIIIGNPSMRKVDNMVYNPLNAILQQRILPFLKRNIRVLFSTLGENAIPLGITSLVIDHIFSTPSLKNQ